jgi:signal transduction histidine kinase
LNEVIEIESFDGGRKIIRNSAMPLEDNGAIVGGVVLLEDVTDRLRSEQALIRAEKLASAGRLAATIAHEINNPLEAVTNILYLLAQNRSLPDETRDYARLAEQELTRVAHIAKQTLGFYRETAAPAVVDVAAQLDELLMIYWKRMAEKKIDLVRDYEPGTDITCYPGELRQVVSNLISNAIDATTGGSIKVRARRSVSPNTKRKGVRITVADTGTGISSKRLPHVFEPFYTTKKDVGTGLGLWVCQNIITKHGGSIRVRSSVVTESHGTVFSVFLPGLASARNQQAARAAGVPRHGSQRDEE